MKIAQLTSEAPLQLLLPLAQEWHRESRFQHLPFSTRKFWNFSRTALARGRHGAVFVAVSDEKAVGVINLAVGEGFLSEGGCYATCLAWYQSPRIRKSLLNGIVAHKLLATAKGWARDGGALELLVHGTHGLGGGLASRGTVIGPNVVIELF